MSIGLYRSLILRSSMLEYLTRIEAAGYARLKISQFEPRRYLGLCGALDDLVISPIQHLLAVSLRNVFSNLLILYSINQTKLNLPVFSTNSKVSLTYFRSPTRISVLMFLSLTFFFNSFLGSS